MVAHAHNSSIQEAASRGSLAEGEPGIDSKILSQDRANKHTLTFLRH